MKHGIRALAALAAVLAISLRLADEITTTTTLAVMATIALVALASWRARRPYARSAAPAAVALVAHAGLVLWSDFSAELDTELTLAISLSVHLLVGAVVLVMLVSFTLQHDHVLGLMGLVCWACGWALTSADLLWVNLMLVGIRLEDIPAFALSPMVASTAGGTAFALLAFRDTVRRWPRRSRVGLGFFVVLAIALIATQHRLIEGVVTMEGTETSVAHVDGLGLQRDVIYAVFVLALAAWLRSTERAKPTDPIPPATVVS